VRCGEDAQDHPRKHKLDGHREHARAMPTAAPVKELPAAGAERGDYVLEVGRRRRNRTQCRRIERAAARSQEHEGRNPAPDLKPAAGDVLVRDPVCGQVQNRSEEEGAQRRADDRAGCGTSCNVQGDDH
jgi:hypothetical protein